MKATVVTDASFCHQTRAGGWAAWIAMDGGIKIKDGGCFHVLPNNATEAELYAALNGIWLAVKRGADEVLLQSDCMAVIDAIKGRVTNNKAGKILRDARVTHFKGIVISAKHVKGHTTVDDSRSWCNRWADAEAKKHMKAQRHAFVGT